MKTVQENRKIDFLENETIRLIQEYGIRPHNDFCYDISDKGKIGLVIETNYITDCMKEDIKNAGYECAGVYSRNVKCTLYLMDKEKLVEIHKKLNL